jgi:hypothetical protein
VTRALALPGEQPDRDLGYAAAVSRAHLSVALVALALACATKPPAVTTAPEPTTSPRSADPAPPEGPLVQALRGVAASCEVGLVGDLDGCDGPALEAGLAALEVPAFAVAIASECRLLADADREVARLAMARLHWLANRIDRDDPALVLDGETLECLRAGVFVPDPINRSALLEVFMTVALASGAHEAVFTMLRALPDRGERSLAYMNLVESGGPRSLPLVERLLAVEPDPELRGQALRSLVSRDFPDSGPDHEVICKIMSRYAGDPAREPSERALDALGAFCPADYPRMVEVITALQTSKTLTARHIRAVVSLAGGFRATPARQAEAADLLARLAADPGLASETRADALTGVARQDPPRARKLALKYRSDPDPVVAAAAAAVLASAP